MALDSAPSPALFPLSTHLFALAIQIARGLGRVTDWLLLLDSAFSPSWRYSFQDLLTVFVMMMAQKLLGFGSSQSESQPTNTQLLALPGHHRSGGRPVVEIRERIYKDAFKRQYVNSYVGFGLISNQTIPAGTILFVDRLFAVWRSEQKDCKSLHQANDLIQKKARALGPKWFNQFLMLSRPSEQKLGTMAAIYNAHHVVVAWGDQVGGAVGLNLAWMNHSCIPNCTLSIVDKHPVHRSHGRPPRRVGRAVVRTCAEIAAGQELTIPYAYISGVRAARQNETFGRFNFRCACRACHEPQVAIEETLDQHSGVQYTIDRKDIIANHPSLAIQFAYNLIWQSVRSRMYDLRVAMLWVKCALIAAHHSDLGRAQCFLVRARQMALILEGPHGALYRQVSHWYLAPTLMPGYGGTRRGLSTPLDALTIFHHKRQSRNVLFMLGCDPNEYIRIRRYRFLRPGDANFQAGELRYEILPDVDHAPPPLIIDPNEDEGKSKARDRQDQRGEKTTQNQDQNQNQEKKKKKKKKTKKKAKGGAGKGCVDPEKDFLDLFLEVVDNFECPECAKEASNADCGAGAGAGAGACAGACAGADAHAEGKPGAAVPGQNAKNEMQKVKEKAVKEGAERNPKKGEEKNSAPQQPEEPAEPAEGAEGPQKQKKKRKGRKKNGCRNDATAEPVIQDVGAEKQVVLVEAPGFPGRNEQAEQQDA
ncbi:hypothetical protein P175DRAFT_0559377 [Aspergillus ochraceoroseus IBT 24754]|uniref:SET domain-containing protein n=1 Tax=Aspergillus ochraceoroseus IBT 24754 TaxID=1392256 RepID=A0A2T5LQK0_9EURO|nr:uncharacterized protein P175DRAFT_0559377 [Aspergillus ochraceoroseus IBT 24754]PTU18557.1 hypothetical protein P175DRAFT_0559377 [Aspergillus ochraceoroseus IBT 24754]